MIVKKRVSILISGRGSNMAALITAAREQDFPAEIVGVVSDRADAPGLAYADAAGIVTKVLPRVDFDSKEAHDQAIDATLHVFGAEIVCLAGYMRLLTDAFVAEWSGRMINIHPALLPLFKGLDTHRRAIEAGVRIHGCTVHFVTPQMDDGPIIAQAAVPVPVGDTEEKLAARVLKAEHRLYPLALRLVAEDKARMEGVDVVFSGFEDANANRSGTLFAPEPLQTDYDLEHLARITP
ncbi:phosphoribosylglycinamide formyltransferase [Mesorhizobium sp. LHD-90]|uniref:phosphoribosylglycinamide formyltransferase n=1 Tax=Mesorhizobium sp. LHD-90 TaxID=3071414 RepID=UPI0027DFCFD3|nr:phosphoribosylglycinamide formyltransferase [Mesorhizobium sp. LHD-90]MDQ6434331.1 phosphoribosylglycinamide formyltransferase [Mesorhizobium sp. LHD-90]